MKKTVITARRRVVSTRASESDRKSWRLPSGLNEAILYFLASRAVLTIIGVLSASRIHRRTEGRLEWIHPSQKWLDIWGQWDTGWYLDIAKNWYAAEPHFQGYCNYAFFPLYPTLMKLFGAVMKNHFLAGLIISNVALLGAAILLYRLVEADHDKEVADRSVKYMFIWPTSFILSGVLSEGLFLMLAICSFYYARKGKWLNASIAGFFLSLTRVPGVFVGIPLVYEYMKGKSFRVKEIGADILLLALIPLGFLVYSLYCHYLTGDFLAFVHIQQSGWGHQFGNPFRSLVDGIIGSSGNPRTIVAVWFTMFTLISLVMFFRKLPFSHVLFCFLLLFLPLIKGLGSMPRYTVVLFPMFILFAQLGRDRRVDAVITILLTALMGCFMVFWSIGDTLII